MLCHVAMLSVFRGRQHPPPVKVIQVLQRLLRLQIKGSKRGKDSASAAVEAAVLPLYELMAGTL